MIGNLINFKVEDTKVVLNYENKNAYVEIINPGLINFFVPLFREEKLSKAIENLEYEPCEFSVEENEDGLVINTQKLTIKVYGEFKVDIYDKNGKLLCEDYKGARDPFVRKGVNVDLAAAEGHKIATETEFKVFVSKAMDKDTYFYGFGERPGSLNKREVHYRNWNTDDPKPHGETFEQLYKSVPFFITLKDKEAYGIFFDNTFEAHFDTGKENSNYYYFASVDGNLDYYFIYGPSIKEVIGGYTKLTGTTPVPQLWTLGYQQCRWAYSPDARVLEIAKELRERDIPCDTIYLDIEYMDGFRVFTWDGKRFPNPEKTLQQLKEMGFKVVTIIDPGVKKDAGYKIYDEGIENGYFATDKDNVVYSNHVWPGTSVFPNFLSTDVRKWWAGNQKIMTDTGVAGIWNDMNEPASFHGPLPDDVMFNEDGIPMEHKEVHNVFGHLMSKATYEGLKDATGKRPFVVTRACYSGTQKYSTVWTGDNQSTWEHLRMSIPMLMNLGLSGLTFCGTDVGGFGYDCTSELLSRWVQMGTFTPLFRNHSADNTKDQEPWAFDKETEDINRKYIRLRYELLPYLYDIMWQGEKTGAAMIRPLIYHYQHDEKTYEISDQFLCGENILVAPVVEQGRKARMVYLPQGDNWIDYWTGEEFKGGQNIIKETPLDICPMYMKAGTIIPTYEVQNFIGEKSIDTLKLNVYLSKENTSAVYNHYKDDGETFEYRLGAYNNYEIAVNNNDVIEISLNMKNNNYNDEYKNIKIIVNNTQGKEVVVNSNNLEKNENGVKVLKDKNKTIIEIGLKK